MFDRPIDSVTFVWRKAGSDNSVVPEASDAGRLLLVKNGDAVEDIWTLNDKKTIRFRQRSMHTTYAFPLENVTDIHCLQYRHGMK
jgi:hypothetical protein